MDKAKNIKNNYNCSNENLIWNIPFQFSAFKHLSE